MRDRFTTQLVQIALHEQGLDPGSIDGIWGDKTEHAYRRYIALNQDPIHTPNYDDIEIILSLSQRTDMFGFKENWYRNKQRYEAVALMTHVPARLIAALHWRESGGDFNTYLHQGDPLGKPAVHEPNNIPVFNEWEPAAVHALLMKEGLRMSLGITAATTDDNKLCDYAEHYNGLGYRRRGVASPYVLAGSSGYISGKYVSDHIFDPHTRDNQLGVLAMLRAIV